MAKLTLNLRIAVRDALYRHARHEHRQPEDQAALIVERELVRVGELPIREFSRAILRRNGDGEK